MWQGYKNFDHYFNFDQRNDFFLEVIESIKLVDQPVAKTYNVNYINVPASFDIETYSCYNKGRKFAHMYVWQLGINGSTLIGRTWGEFVDTLHILSTGFNLDKHNRLILYVHNLSYEFQFMRKWIEWETDSKGKAVVFSLKPRKPIYALSALGIEFRCSYILSNYRLAYIGAKLLNTYKVEKKVGDLDYTVPRNCFTPLTPTEIGYCVSDVQVVMAYIQEQIEQYGNIAKLPLTNTGRVRNFTRDYVFGSYCKDPFERRAIAAAYYDRMSYLQITSEMEYDMLKSAFMGGFTHANALHVNTLLHGVGSGDLTSSYPATMCADYYPASSAKYVGQPTDEELANYLQTKCCLMCIEFYNLTLSFDYEGYISSSKCSVLSDDAVVNNGRVMSASHLITTITEIDFDIISKVYEADDFEIKHMYIYSRGYLPRDLIMAILKLYGDKTSLKGIADKVIEYMVSKNMINAEFGMIVTDIVRKEAIYTDDWVDPQAPDAQKQLEDYNQQYTRFLFYPWGVWVTAHARHNLWEAIFEFGEDYVYADTDSIKGLNFEKHLKFFDDYNTRQLHKLCNMCSYYKIPVTLCMPKTKKGVEKVLGFWDREEDYRYFKTMGAKRYCYEYEDGIFNMTVAGVNKTTAVPYLLSHFCGFDLDLCKLAYTSDPNLEEESKEAMKKLVDQHNSGKSYIAAFKAFTEALTIPPEHCGKMTHTYVDNHDCAVIVDNFGNRELAYEKSFTHLEPAGYDFSIAETFMDYLLFGITTDAL